MRVYGIEPDGQLTVVDKYLGFNYLNYIVDLNTMPMIKEYQQKKHYSYICYCNPDGSPTLTSETKQPWSVNLSTDRMVEGMVVGFFYRVKHHYEGVRLLLLQITKIDLDEKVYEAKLIDHGFINRVRYSNKFSEFIRHGEKMISDQNPYPFNKNANYCQEQMFLIYHAGKYRGMSQTNTSLIWESTRDYGKLLFGTAFYEKNLKKNKIKIHFIKKQPLTYRQVQEDMTKIFKRIPKRVQPFLVRLNTHTGESFIGLNIAGEIKMVVHSGGRHFSYQLVEQHFLDTYIKSIKPLISEEWDLVAKRSVKTSRL